MICIYHYKTEQHPISSTEEFANKAFVLIKDVTGSDTIKFLTIEKNKRGQEEAIDIIKRAGANLMEVARSRYDYVIIDNISSLGTNHYNNYQIITTLLINKVIVLFADADIPLKDQIDPNFNKQFLTGIQYHLYSLKEQENNNKKSVGRPVVQYPVGWEQNYTKWKNKEISSKSFMEQMGLKKATFYNLLTEYKSEKKL